MKYFNLISKPRLPHEVDPAALDFKTQAGVLLWGSTFEAIEDLMPEERLESVHGSSHMERVMQNCYRMADYDHRADSQVLCLFAHLHDVCRHSDGPDPDHGPRAARLVESMRYTYFYFLTDEQFAMLLQAVREHTARTEPSGIPTVDIAIDGDRLDLTRIGIMPDPDLMLSEPGKLLARKLRNAPPRNIKGEVVYHVKHKIIRRYRKFDAGHNTDHVVAVINESCRLAEKYGADPLMAFVAAAFHDLGLPFGRKYHHLASGQMLFDDTRLFRWFTFEQLTTMREAIEDHRSSLQGEPRSIYGRILHEADVMLDCDTVLRRALQYRMKEGVAFDDIFDDTYHHLVEKYGEGGYLKIYLPEGEDNVERLARLRELISDREATRKQCMKLFKDLC